MLFILIYTEEVWKDLNVSNVKSDLYEISNYGNIRNKKRNKILKCQVSSTGYKRLILQTSNLDVTEKWFSVHRLVALTFIKNSDQKINTVVNHINGDKLNNFEGNLEWTTPKLNIQHAVENKLHWQYVGENHPNCKFTNEMVCRIYDLSMMDGMTSRDVCNIIKQEYPKLNYLTDIKLIQYIGRIRRKERFSKIIDNRGSTNIKRNID